MEDGGDLGSGRRVQHTPKDQVPIVKNQDGNRAEKTQNFDPVQLVLVPALNFSSGDGILRDVRTRRHFASQPNLWLVWLHSKPSSDVRGNS
jgi:hypothetical protein